MWLRFLLKPKEKNSNHSSVGGMLEDGCCSECFLEVMQSFFAQLYDLGGCKPLAFGLLNTSLWSQYFREMFT